jgi:hypothetical protein
MVVTIRRSSERSRCRIQGARLDDRVDPGEVCEVAAAAVGRGGVLARAVIAVPELVPS